MTDRLRNDVIFVNVDGCNDSPAHCEGDVRKGCFTRLDKVKRIHNQLTKLGLRSYRFNPVDGDISYVPIFDVSIKDGLYTYSTFILFDLYNQLKRYKIDYSHVIIYQADGFPTNVDKWTDKFLQYDFIGVQNVTTLDMNGGFSLRSKRLLKRSSDLFEIERYKEFLYEHGHGNEDVIYNRFGYIKKYPPWDITDQFASSEPSTNSFGFHTNDTFDFDSTLSLLTK
jgi:hypothetical protein